MSEIIIIKFLPEEENQTWKKRKPHIINIKTNTTQQSKVIEVNKNKASTNNNQNISGSTKLTKPAKYINEKYSEVEKIITLSENVKTHTEKDMLFDQIKQVEIDIKQHINYFTNKEYYHQYINFRYQFAKIKHNLGYEPEFVSRKDIKKIELKYIKPKPQEVKKHIRNTYSSKGISIAEKLTEIKIQIKSNNNTEEDIGNLLKRLQEIKNDIENNMSVFTNIDNISMRLQQIEQYTTKLEEKLDSLKIHNKAVVKEKTNNIQISGITKRGKEIQQELANLRDEVKRKDLNPIEKENLKNALLRLQNEISSQIDKFSKYDSIPVRLNQIDNYLEKLSEKEVPVKNDSSSSQIIKKETKEEEKSRKQKIIWKFSL